MTDSPGSCALSFTETFVAESLVAEFIPESRLHEFVTESPVVEPIAEAEPLAREYLLGTHEAFPAELLFTEWFLELLVRELLPKLLIRKTELAFPEFLIGGLLAELLAPESLLREAFVRESELPFSEFLVAPEPLATFFTGETVPEFLTADSPLTELLASLCRLLRLGLHGACPRAHLTACSGASS